MSTLFKVVNMAHIYAEVYISDNVPYPKKNGIRTGYAPHHKFDGINYLVSGFHTYEDGEMHYPGEYLKTKISFPSWDEVCDKIVVGEGFELMELDRSVGKGVVISII
ncbi:hypothetical protein [Duganella radicis]|uniref:Uncharacterized protein n=1 Tax=Duganella radicis TaxID=551988 RepID=A0A6L6PNR7_9BURK|nr:hypothetical protein [Duganella radicis]MTV40552.1 hypothetical protein [Duganella radicis]